MSKKSQIHALKTGRTKRNSSKHNHHAAEMVRLTEELYNGRKKPDYLESDLRGSAMRKMKLAGFKVTDETHKSKTSLREQKSIMKGNSYKGKK